MSDEMWDFYRNAARDAAKRLDEREHEEALIEADDQARRLWNRQHGFPEDGSGR